MSMVQLITDVSKVFDNTWLSRYPRPQYMGFDNGSEFKKVFTEMCQNYGIKKKPSTTYNPQSNGIIERVHQVLANALRTFELEECDLDEHDPWSSFLSAAAYAIRSTYHTTLESTPAQLVYGRDMILPISFQTDWARLQLKRQKEMNRNNLKENSRRIIHKYKAEDKVLLLRPGKLRKMSSPRTGPHKVEKTYDNGTITICCGVISERVNIRRVIPYSEL